MAKCALRPCPRQALASGGTNGHPLCLLSGKFPASKLEKSARSHCVGIPAGDAQSTLRFLTERRVRRGPLESAKRKPA
jgi:hypothetical protein